MSVYRNIHRLETRIKTILSVGKTVQLLKDIIWCLGNLLDCPGRLQLQYETFAGVELL